MKPLLTLRSTFSRLPRKRSLPLCSQYVNIDADILGGTPVFVGTRVPVTALFDYLEGNLTVAEFLEDFPSMRKDLVIAFLTELAHYYKRVA